MNVYYRLVDSLWRSFPKPKVRFKTLISLCVQMECEWLRRAHDWHFRTALYRQCVIVGTSLQQCCCRDLLFLTAGDIACLIQMLFINVLC